MAKKKSFATREQNESSEPYSTESTGLPEERFNTTAQVSTAPETQSTTEIIKGDAAPGSQAVTASAATAVKKKMVVRPSSEAELESGKQIGGVPLGNSGARANVAGTASGESAVDSGTVPYTKGGGRPTTRYGKKISTDNFVFNNTISEQIVTTVEESKDLREAGKDGQGYNGIKQFKVARGRKTAGTVPGSLLFDRSADFIEHDALIHTTGQVLDNIEAQANYPTITSEMQYEEVDGVDTAVGEKYVNITDPMGKSNYLPTAFKFDIVNGHIANVRFEEIQYVAQATIADSEQANMNWQVDANNVANTMIHLQTNLGRETTEKWSPLGYVIEQPYEYNMLFHDMEAVTGAMMAAAYRSSAHSLAFQVNKRGKDGAKGISPIYEMMHGSVGRTTSSAAYNLGENVHDNVFGKGVLRAGSPAGIIAMFDSTAKYTTIADFFNQPRSFKFHLQTVDNNISALHCKEEFLRALNSESVFSTEDGNYNPMLPIHITRDIHILNPLSLNYFLQGWTNPKVDLTNENKETGTKAVYRYSYKDVRNTYYWDVKLPLVEGLLRWMLRHEANIIKAYGLDKGESGNITVTWPINFSTTYPGMFAFALCSASQDIAWMRNVVLRDVIFAGEQSEYIWKDLEGLDKLNPLQATQYKYSDYGTGLRLGKLSANKAIRIFWPEHISVREVDIETSYDNHSVASYWLPWYMNEQSVSAEYDSLYGFTSIDNPHVMTMPSVRAGVNHFAVDLLYGMTERDVRLSLDRMVSIPVFTGYLDKKKKNSKGYTTISSAFVGLIGNNAYGFGDDPTGLSSSAKFAAARYDEVSDGRVIMYCPWDQGEDYARVLRDATYICTPRELGFIFTCPTSICTPVVDEYYGDDKNTSTKIGMSIDGSAPISLVSYSAANTVKYPNAIERSAALMQEWVATIARRDVFVVNANNNNLDKTGIVPSLNAFVIVNKDPSQTKIDASMTTAPIAYGLRKSGLSTAVGNTKVVTFSRFFWSILQRLYFPVGVFDGCYDSNTITTLGEPSTGLPLVDPIEVSTYFGVCGALGSDFNQDSLERLTIKDELGMYYTEDEFIKSSLIFRE